MPFEGLCMSVNTAMDWLFKEQVGITPYQFYINDRIKKSDRACKLICPCLIYVLNTTEYFISLCRQRLVRCDNRIAVGVDGDYCVVGVHIPVLTFSDYVIRVCGSISAPVNDVRGFQRQVFLYPLHSQRRGMQFIKVLQ